MEQLFVNKPTGKQPNFNGSFHLVALVCNSACAVVAHMLSNPWWIMNGKLPIQWTLEKEKKWWMSTVRKMMMKGILPLLNSNSLALAAAYITFKIWNTGMLATMIKIKHKYYSCYMCGGKNHKNEPQLFSRTLVNHMWW